MPSRAKTPSPRKTKPKPKTRAGAAPSAERATREPGPAPGEAAATEAQTAISASRGLVDFLRTHRISFALTSYQTGQLMLIGVLPNGSLSVFQRNFVRAMGLWATPQTLYLSSIAQLWRLENVLGPGTSGEQAIRPALRAAQRADHGRSRYSRDCDGTRRPAGVRQHQIFLPRHFRSCAQLQVAVAPGLYLKARARGPLSSEWARDAGRRAQICHRRQPQRRGRRLARAACTKAASSSTSRPTGSSLTDLSMPHSPRLANGALWVLDSGRGYLCRVDEASGATSGSRSAPGSCAGCPSGATSLWSRPRCRATIPSRVSNSTTTSRRATPSRVAAPILSTRGAAIFCIGSASRAPCASCSMWIPARGAGADERRPRQPRDAHPDHARRRGGSGSGHGEGGGQDRMNLGRHIACSWSRGLSTPRLPGRGARGRKEAAQARRGAHWRLDAVRPEHNLILLNLVLPF